MWYLTIANWITCGSYTEDITLQLDGNAKIVGYPLINGAPI